MINIPVKVKDRLTAGIKRFQPIADKARTKDINESDTVTIISDMLSDVFGYDKYTEITSEFAIKKTYCDLAIKIDGQVKLLIEAKAAGLDLKEQYIRQAVDYGANAGIEWVVLTNSVNWKIYNIAFGKPVTAELVYEFDFTQVSAKRQADMEQLYYLTREAMTKGNKTSLDEFKAQQQVVNKYTISQILLNDAVLDVIRRSLKKLSADVKSTNEDIYKILIEEIIKRDVLDDEKTPEAKRKVSRALKPAPKPTKPQKPEESPEGGMAAE